jgi:hypothetical protein
MALQPWVIEFDALLESPDTECSDAANGVSRACKKWLP